MCVCVCVFTLNIFLRGKAGLFVSVFVLLFLARRWCYFPLSPPSLSLLEGGGGVWEFVGV